MHDTIVRVHSPGGLPLCGSHGKCWFACTALLQQLGEDFDERVLPSIGNEVLKAVVVRVKYKNNSFLQTLLYIFALRQSAWAA